MRNRATLRVNFSALALSLALLLASASASAARIWGSKEGVPGEDPPPPDFQIVETWVDKGGDGFTYFYVRLDVAPFPAGSFPGLRCSGGNQPMSDVTVFGARLNSDSAKAMMSIALAAKVSSRPVNVAVSSSPTCTQWEEYRANMLGLALRP